MNDLVALHGYTRLHITVNREPNRPRGDGPNGASQCQIWIPPISIICLHEITSNQPFNGPFSSGVLATILLAKDSNFSQAIFHKQERIFSIHVIVAKLISHHLHAQL